MAVPGIVLPFTMMPTVSLYEETYPQIEKYTLRTDSSGFFFEDAFDLAEKKLRYAFDVLRQEKGWGTYYETPLSMSHYLSNLSLIRIALSREVYFVRNVQEGMG